MNEIVFGQEPEPKENNESRRKRVEPEVTAPKFSPVAEPAPETLNSEVISEVKELAHEHILGIIEKKGAAFAKMDNAALESFIGGEVQSLVFNKQIPLNDSEIAYVADSLYKEIAGFGPLEDLLSDPAVEDIMINGAKDVYVSRGGQMTRARTKFTDNNHLLRIVRRILAPLGRRLDESSPMVD
ncbi:MAG: CpaF family protein, partial [Limnobacter sp.]|nr:CpaF family protein [Limnobacter sp.]